MACCYFRNYRLFFAKLVKNQVKECRCLCTTSSKLQESSSDDEYSSQNDTSTSEEEESTKHKILNAALKFVPQYGWSQRSIASGSEEIGLPSVAHGMFPRGGGDLALHFYSKCNTELTQTLAVEVEAAQEDSTLKKKTRIFIRDGLEARLRMIVPYIDKWPEAMGIMALPENIPDALSHLTHLADTIWYYAGDKSTDTNWYTRRLSLAAVYKTSEIYMVQDGSDDYTDTWSFMERRLKEVANVGDSMNKVSESTSVLMDSLYGAFRVAQNMTGMNSYRR